MISADFLKEKIKKIISKDVIYYIFPVFLITILYYSILSVNQVYIGEWHDIFANSFYYTIVDNNYLATWNNLGNGGFPLTANPHSDKYYIFSFPFYLIFQNLTIVNFILLFHLIIAYFAFFKLGSLITKNYNALLIFSVFFAFSGILLARLGIGHHLLLYGLVWIPLLYYFFFKIVVFDDCTLLNLIFLSIVSALVYFTGNIYYFVFAYLIIFIFFLYYALNKKISKKIIYYLILSVFLTMLLISIKMIPDVGVSGSIIRNDLIDPLAGGGSIENDLSSFITGNRIDTLWGPWESVVMIGIIPVLLMIFAFIYGRKDIIIPSFLAILISLIWAAGGKTVLSFLHFLPIVNSLRNPGRIFGALLPIVLFLALYGAILVCEKYRNGGDFAVSSDQKKRVIIGVALLIVVKLFELPFQEMITPDAALSIILVGAFVALLYFQKVSMRNILIFFIIALLINCILILQIHPLDQIEFLIKLVLVGILFAGFYIFIIKNRQKDKNTRIFCGILLVGLLLMFMGNLGSGYVIGYYPELEKSLAPKIIEKISKFPSDNAQLWVYETGLDVKHVEFSYWDIINGIHPMSLYSAYYLNTMPLPKYIIGNVTYYSVDYVIDTKYLENGNQNIPEYTFKVENISVYKPDHVLPNVFFIRNDLVYPLTIEKFSPDEVIASGELLPGDIVILKGAYYQGWKVNDVDAKPFNGMIGTQLQSNTKNIRFNFDPLDYKVGALLSGFGIILILVLLLKRKEIDAFFSKSQESVVNHKNKKKKMKD